MYWLRVFATALTCCCVVFGLQSAHAQPSDQASGVVHVLIFGEDGRAMTSVGVEIGSARQDTNADGAASLQAREGAQRIRLHVPQALVPRAPIEQPIWRLDLTDVPVVSDETTEVIVTLSAAGALIGMDVQAPESGGGRRSLQREFARALAEKPRGSVVGTVVASEGGAPVAGARVYVRGAPIEAETDGNGAFKLELPEGSYALSVIHTKFSTQSIPDVKVQGDLETPLRIELSPASVELEELVVTAPHIEGGIASLISERRETTAVADLIGAEQMARSGDTSAASALARVTGLTVVDGRFVIVRGLGERYSTMTLNRLQVPSPEPTRRVVPLDLFPSGVLESVIVQKTYSPDLPAEFGGGLVQVRSRSYPDKFLLNVSLTGAFNTQTHLRNQWGYQGGSRDWLGVDDGTRALPRAIERSPKLALANIFSAPGEGYTAEQLEQFGESLPSNWNRTKQFVPLDYGAVLSVGNKFKLRHAKLGFVGAASYKNEYAAVSNSVTRTVRSELSRIVAADDFRLTTMQQQISASAFLDWGVEFSDKQKLKFTTMLLRQTDDSTTVRTGFDQDTNAESQVTRLSWVERQVFLQQATGNHQFEALHDFQADWRYAYSRASRNEPDRRDYNYIAPRGTSDYRLASGGSNQRLWGTLNDATHEAQLDLAQPLPLWSALTGKLKAGTFFYRRTRDAAVRRFEYNVSSSLSTDLLALPPEQIFTPATIGPNAAFREVSLSNDTYEASMDLQAGYGLLELPVLKSVDLMAGARLEHSLIKVSTFDQFAPNNPPEIARLDNLDVLPAATVTWRVYGDFQLRGGYSRTVNRPDLRELSSGRFNDVESNSLLVGSRDLKRAKIDNYDVRLEWYYTSDEVFSIGAFLKTFDDPIETTIRGGSELIYSFINTDSAIIRGLEFEMRKRFDFIDSALDPLYFAGNVSWIDSEVELDLARGGTYKRPLQSQSPWVVNAQLGWDDTAPGGTGTAAALLYNVAGRRVRAVGDPNLDTPDQYEQPFHRLDLVLSQTLPRGWRLGVKAQNLLNSMQVWKQGNVDVRRFRRGVDIAASLAWSY